ncbi:MAG: SLC13 family permease [Myxococcota bacterium]
MNPLAWIEAWDAAQERPAYRAVGLALGLCVIAAAVATAPPAGLSVEAWRTAGVALAMAGWWIGGVAPTAVTALVPLVAFPVLKVATIEESAAPYADPLIFLMIGGSVLGHAMERVGLHERVVAGMLAPEWLRRGPRRVLLAMMVGGAVISSFVSNTASALMMLPIALLLADRCKVGRSTFALGVAHAVSIGGVTTLIGTFPNAVFAKMATEQAGRPVGFASWLVVGVPFTVLALPVAWVLLARRSLPAGTELVEAPPVPAWRPGERFVAAVWAVAAVAWVTRKPIDLGLATIPGWSNALGLGSGVDDAWVAMGAALVLFVAPAAEGRPVVELRRFEQVMPWGVMFLLGGGFALATRIESTGLAAWMAGPAASLASLPGPVAVLVICAVVTLLSEVTSNTATTQLMLPLLLAGAKSAGVDPMAWMVPATIAASCGFMMPISTPPMAIAAEGGGVRPAEMAVAGFALDLVLVGIAAVVGTTLAPLAFPPP